MRYEEWEGVHPEGEPGLIFIPDNERKERQLAIHFPDGAECVWWVEASSWEEADGPARAPRMGALHSHGPSYRAA